LAQRDASGTVSLPKSITIQVLEDTWPRPEEVPVELTGAQATNPYAIDVLCCLLFAALWMRPPVRYGFSLSDCWAWLRYFPAISTQRELRLREEWTHLDPHHKVVLSGDFGVGFATWLLNRTLGFVRFADTLWVVNALAPGLFELGRSTKRGPDKSPDYIAQDIAGEFSVVECKGTQTSHASLLQAINRGIPQKANLRAVGTTQIRHSLVAGLFVPQFESPDNATLMVADPDWRIVKEKLSQFTTSELARGVAQIAYAKELALLEFSNTANALARAKGSADSLTAAFTQDLQSPSRVRTIDAEGVRIRREYLWPRPAFIAENVRVGGVLFEGTLPSSEIAKFHTIASPFEQGEQKGAQLGNWGVGAGEYWVELKSPLGSTLRLSLLPP
jgi:hypothetical protein